MTIDTVRSHLAAFSQTDRGRAIIKWTRRIFILGVAGMLVYQFTGIGWAEVVRSLPTTPLFYVIFLVMYFSLPGTETLIYRTTWKFRPLDGFLTFVKKRIYNKDVLGYSGEIYLYLWAEKNVGLPRRQIAGVVKDNNIVSSVASTLFAAAVLGVLLYGGVVALPERIAHFDALYVGVAVILGLGLAGLVLKFRRSIFALSGKMLALLFGMHLGRLVLVNILQIAQWMIVLPDVSLNVWLTMIAVLIVATRIPFLPARDLIFIGASVELSRLLQVTPAAIAGMLIAASALDKGLNLLLFTAVSTRSPQEPTRELEAEPISEFT